MRPALCLAAAAVLGGCGAISFLGGTGPVPKAAPTPTVKRCYQVFRSALGRWDFAGAYGCLSKRTRERYGYEIFRLAFLTDLGVEFRRQILESSYVGGIVLSDGDHAVGFLRQRSLVKGFRLTKEDSDWRIIFSLEEFFGLAEEAFFSPIEYEDPRGRR